MWVAHVTAAGLCGLFFFVALGVTAQVSQSSLEDDGDAVYSPHNFRHKMALMSATAKNEDGSDDGMEKLGFLNEENGYDDDDKSDDLAFLDEIENGAIQEDGEPPEDSIDANLMNENTEDTNEINEPVQASSSSKRRLYRRIIRLHRRLIYWRRQLFNLRWHIAYYHRKLWYLHWRYRVIPHRHRALRRYMRRCIIGTRRKWLHLRRQYRVKFRHYRVWLRNYRVLRNRYRRRN